MPVFPDVPKKRPDACGTFVTDQ